jgi:multimeric flavodoxin WrbA
MKVLALQGSPHTDGNTATMLDFVKKYLGGGHSFERIDLVEMKVSGCHACYECQHVPDTHGCAVEDDGQAILDKVLEADAIIYATPLYMWGIASWLRAIMERHLSCVMGYMTGEWTSLVKGKTVALLVTAGGPAEQNADAVTTVFQRFTDYGKTKSLGTYVVPLCTTPDELGEKGEEIAKRLADDIASS